MLDSLEGQLTARQREWLEHIRACESAGQTMVEYAAAHGLDVKALYGWKKRLVSKGVLKHRLSGKPGFQRVRIAGEVGREWRIQLPNGVSVAFSGAVDSAALTAVLKAAVAI